MLKDLRALLIKRLVPLCLTQYFSNLVDHRFPFPHNLFDFLKEEFHCIKYGLESLALDTLTCCSTVSYVHPVFFIKEYLIHHFKCLSKLSLSVIHPPAWSSQEVVSSPTSELPLCFMCICLFWHCLFSILNNNKSQFNHFHCTVGSLITEPSFNHCSSIWSVHTVSSVVLILKHKCCWVNQRVNEWMHKRMNEFMNN